MPYARPYDYAMIYLGLKWSILPVTPQTLTPTGTLLPTVWNQTTQRLEPSWHPYRTRRPRNTTVDGWLEQQPETSLGVVAGTASQLAVLTLDEDGFAEHVGLPNAKSALATSGMGMRAYYRYDGPPIAPETKIGIKGIGIVPEGRWVLAPPSRHPEGRLTQWGIPPWEAGDYHIVPLPDWAREKIIPLEPHVVTSPTIEVRAEEYLYDEEPEREAFALQLLMNRVRGALAPLVRGVGVAELQNAAFELGQMLPMAYIAEREAKNVLLVAAEQLGFDRAEIYPAITAALADGATEAYTLDEEALDEAMRH